MEIRRIEGIFLQHALETSQGLRAQSVGEQIRIRLLSTVPESLLEAFSEGGLLRGYVLEAYGKNLRILLNNSQEVLAENNSTLEIQEGDHLELVLESKNPISLKIISLQRRTNIDQVLDSVFNPEASLFDLEDGNLRTLINNSGIFYERKLLGFLLGNISLDEILQDTKAQTIQNLISLTQEIHNQLNLKPQPDQSLDSIKKLFLYVMNKTEGIVEVKNLLKSLYLEDLNSWEFAQSSQNIPAGRSIQLVLERLKAMIPSLRDQELKEHLSSFVKALNGGSLEDLAESHKRLVNLLKDRERFLLLRERIEREGLQLMDRLNAILQAQRIMANEGFLVIPFKYKDGKGGIVIKPNKEEYRVFINLNYPEGFVCAVLSCPKLKGAKGISLSFYTNFENFYNKIEANRRILEQMLKEEGFRIREFKISLVSMVEDLKKSIKQELQDTNLYLVV